LTEGNELGNEIVAWELNLKFFSLSLVLSLNTSWLPQISHKFLLLFFFVSVWFTFSFIFFIFVVVVVVVAMGGSMFFFVKSKTSEF